MTFIRQTRGSFDVAIANRIALGFHEQGYSLHTPPPHCASERLESQNQRPLIRCLVLPSPTTSLVALLASGKKDHILHRPLPKMAHQSVEDVREASRLTHATQTRLPQKAV